MPSLPELRALLRQGRGAEVLQHIEAGDGPGIPFRKVALEFDAHWSLGHLDEARVAAREMHELAPGDAGTAERFRRIFAVTGDDQWHPLHLLPSNEGSRDEKQVDRNAELLMRVDDPHRCVRFLEASQQLAPLSPSAHLQLSRAHFVLGDLDTSERIARGVIGSERDLGARRHLKALDFARGRFDDVLKSELLPVTNFDHLRFNALLATGQHAEGFAMLPFTDDLDDLQASFPTQTRRTPSATADRIGVVSESGPGDQLLDATLVGMLSGGSSEVVMTVDPRLLSLLSRSYPEISFLASAPTTEAQFGAFAPTRARHLGPTARFLTADAARFLGERCDEIILGRALKALIEPSTHQPSGRSLTLLPELVRQLRPVADGRVGLSWRSELQNPWRSVHYFSVDDLAPLFASDRRFVCLQHDVRADEKAALIALAGDRVTFLDDLDLRDDFETTAALVRSLDMVVGPSTTMTVLAAAVGTAAFNMHPTRFGQWLAQRPTGFWFAHRQHVCLPAPAPKLDVVAQTVAAMDRYVGSEG